METLKYSVNKLWLRVAGAGAAACALIWLYGNPWLADFLPGEMMIFGGEIGHVAVIPAFIAISAVTGWLAASRLLGGREAIECLPDALRVTSMWGRTRIRWADLGHVYIENRRRRFLVGRERVLVFHYVGAGLFGSKRLRVPLGATELASQRYDEYCAAILAYKRDAGGQPTSTDATADPTSPDAGFDPDAALARYLARKSLEAAAAPAPPPPVALRPTFGRKGL